MKIILKEKDKITAEINITTEEVVSILNTLAANKLKTNKKLFIIKFDIDTDMDFGVKMSEGECNEFGWVDIIEIEANNREEAFEILRKKVLDMICKPKHDFVFESINRMFDAEKENFIKNGKFNLHGNWDNSYFKIIREVDQCE